MKRWVSGLATSLALFSLVLFSFTIYGEPSANFGVRRGTIDDNTLICSGAPTEDCEMIFLAADYGD